MKNSLLIINYHYVRNIKYNSGIYPISIKELKNDIEYLSKEFEFVDSDDFLKPINKPRVLFTFDDGLEEQIEAFDLLFSKGIYSIFFIPSKPYIDNLPLEIHLFHYLRSKYSDSYLFKKLNDLKIFHIDKTIINKSKIQYHYDNEDSAVFKYTFNYLADQKLKNDFINLIFSDLGISFQDFKKDLYFKEGSLKKLARVKSIGVHCHSHVPLSSLSAEGKRKDILLCYNYLKLFQNELSYISYPFGSELSIDKDVFKICKELNLKAGITMKRGVNNLQNKNLNYLDLKRISNNDIKKYLK